MEKETRYRRRGVLRARATLPLLPFMGASASDGVLTSIAESSGALRASLYVPARDGVRLEVDIFRPTDPASRSLNAPVQRAGVRLNSVTAVD